MSVVKICLEEEIEDLSLQIRGKNTITKVVLISLTFQSLRI